MIYPLFQTDEPQEIETDTSHLENILYPGVYGGRPEDLAYQPQESHIVKGTDNQGAKFSSLCPTLRSRLSC